MASAVYNRLHNASFGNGIGMVGSSSSGSAGNALHSQLARSLERILEEAHLSGELILANRKLKDFPKTGTKYNLADTVIADLSRNRFCELPEEITTFPFLETLFLYHNTIRTIPESIKNLTSLTYLDLRSNQLPSLPREVCFLPLQVLLVSNNRLVALPDELGRMDRLTDLDASYNQLSALPARIGELRSLRSFSLRSNQLMYLPRELTCLTLVSLDVSNNRIASLPLEIRQMATLVEFNLENNPLTSPPASLCVRGLVHVFKYLETQATKDEKGARAGGNYDGYTTLRRAPRHNSSGNVLETHRIGRHNVESGYNTCDGIDKRWSHDMPSVKSKTAESPIRRPMPTMAHNSLSAELMDASLTSSTSTIVDDESLTLNAAIVKPLPHDLPNDLSPEKPNTDALLSNELRQTPTNLHHHINYAPSSSSNGSSPEQEDLMLDHHDTQQQHNGKSADEKLNKDLGNIQTYREYKEALKQQRNQEITSVYKIKGQQKQQLYDMSEATNALNSNGMSAAELQDEVHINALNVVNNIPVPKSIMKNTTNGHSAGAAATNGNCSEDNVILPKKPIQKVIPSRNTELMSQATKTQTPAQQSDNEKLSGAAHINGDCLGYVKPSSPSKGVNGLCANASGILTNNQKFSTPTSGGLKSPVNGSALKLTTPKTHRTVTWNHDIPAEKLSFTMRREFDRQREETELMQQLRSIIETRLKMTLPEDIASALTDGVILCHLANYVRPRSVASIHVPSPGVSKLTMARCRRNVDNFLEACRKIGVDEELICSCADVVPACNDDNNEGDTNNCSYANGDNNNECNELSEEMNATQRLPNMGAVLRTVMALIAMDDNPHHQTAKYLQQQKQKLQQQQQQQQRYKQHDQRHDEKYEENANANAKPHNNCANEQMDEQQTATVTKQQMRQNQHEIIANLQFENATLNFNAKCHIENIMTTNDNNQYSSSNGHVEATTTTTTTNSNANTDDDDGEINVDGGNFRQQLARSAKVKTFQKIKFNLITSHGKKNANNNNNYNNNNNNNNNNNIGNMCGTTTTTTTTMTTLQTIVESENDTTPQAEDTTDAATGAAYTLINEKPKTKTDELALKVTTNVYNDIGGNQYKLQQATSEANEKPSAIVSKRIEFFEHSNCGATANTPATPGAGGGGGGAAAGTTTPSPTAVPDSKCTTANALTPNGIVAAAKTKVMHNIFSIYRVQDFNDEKCDSTHKVYTNAAATTMEKLKLQGAGTPLIKHDSYVLTIVLSCIFIVTFLLLIFFPLPG